MKPAAPCSLASRTIIRTVLQRAANRTMHELTGSAGNVGSVLDCQRAVFVLATLRARLSRTPDMPDPASG
jgi:hypothetical protein